MGLEDGPTDPVGTALDVGYRFLDTAQVYGTEGYVGDALARSPVPREEVVVATKVHETNLAYDDVLSSTEESAEKLDVDAIDLLYVHWPRGAYDPDETLPALDELVDRGLVRSVGLSNFLPGQVETAIDRLDAGVAAVQVEAHPLLPQETVREHAREHGYEVVAYTPLVKGELDEVPELVRIAEKHGATAAQVGLAWLIGEGVVPIPKASGEAHLRENFAATELDLDDEDRELIESIEATRRVYDPDDAPWNAGGS